MVAHERAAENSMKPADEKPDVTEASAVYTAVVLAGSRRANDPVAALFDQQYKALVPIAGTTMILRVINALALADSIRDIVVVFDDRDELFRLCPELDEISKRKRVSVVPCGPTICGSIAGAIERSGESWPYMVTTADHALLTSEMVDRFCSRALGSCDVAVGLVEKAYLDATYPNSKRTYLPFRGNKYSGSNLFAFLDVEALKAISFWKRVEQERKNPWKLFAAFGWGSLLGFLLKRFTLEQAFERASKRLGVVAKAITMPYAEAAIDVDSAKDYAQVSEILAKRTDTE